MDYVYSVRDKVAKRNLSLSFAANDATFIRTSLFSILMDYPLKDIEIWRIGKFDADKGVLKPLAFNRRVKVSLGSYVFPTTRMSNDALSVEMIDDAAKKAKLKINEQIEAAKEKEVVNE